MRLCSQRRNRDAAGASLGCGADSGASTSAPASPSSLGHECGLAGDRDACGLAGGSPSKAAVGRAFSQPAKNKGIILESSMQDFIQHSLYMYNEANLVAQGLAI